LITSGRVSGKKEKGGCRVRSGKCLTNLPPDADVGWFAAGKRGRGAGREKGETTKEKRK